MYYTEYTLLLRELTRLPCASRAHLAQKEGDKLEKEVEEKEKQRDAEVKEEKKRRTTNPRNPRHFNIIEGGRKRVSTTFMDKNSVSCA